MGSKSRRIEQQTFYVNDGLDSFSGALRVILTFHKVVHVFPRCLYLLFHQNKRKIGSKKLLVKKKKHKKQKTKLSSTSTHVIDECIMVLLKFYHLSYNLIYQRAKEELGEV